MLPSLCEAQSFGSVDTTSGGGSMALGQALVNWLLLGSFYAAVALGFSLVWGIMNIVNLAHGAFIIVGAYVAMIAYQQAHIDPFAGMLASMLVLFVIGWVVQYVAINR